MFSDWKFLPKFFVFLQLVTATLKEHSDSSVHQRPDSANVLVTFVVVNATCAKSDSMISQNVWHARATPLELKQMRMEQTDVSLVKRLVYLIGLLLRRVN